MSWEKNFVKNGNKIKKDYNERFYRMWDYYLLSCAGLFRAGEADVYQIVFSKNGLKEVYKAVR